MYADPYPGERPAGLRRRRLPKGTELFRIERVAPRSWTWAGFPQPRHRFDSAVGRFRTRYAAQSVHGAARERYLDTGLFIPSDHADHRLIRLMASRPLHVVDLRTEANLVALGIDDRISTGHEPDVWAACHRLVDAVRGWWPELDGIVYRSRTTPATSWNLAFFSLDGLSATDQPLADATDELDDLILHHHLTIDFDH